MSEGSNNTSARLRDAVLDDLVKRIEDGEPLVTEKGPVVDEDGKVVRAPVAPSVITAAIAFLKIFPPQGEIPTNQETSSKLNEYAQKFPFPKK